jgi:DNA-binding response OmpR family regulator
MSHQKRTILIVEDEESITTPLAEALERDGFNAEIAHTVADALGRGRTLRPDLVLLDIGLPDGSGLDVCRELRSSSNVPIIILSAAVRRRTGSSGSNSVRTTMSVSHSVRVR